MPAIIARLTGGTLMPQAEPTESLRAAAADEPTGVYTVFRTYRKSQAVALEAHFHRLEESAELEGMSLKLDRPRLRAGIRHLIELAGYTESRVRITIPLANPEEPILAIEPLQPVPAEVRAVGVNAATVKLSRRNPRAKSNAWEAARAQALKRLPGDAYEGLLVDDRGSILEGFSSNVYAVRGDELHTPDRGILKGISRQILLEVLPPMLKLVKRTIAVGDLASLDEFFLTSSSRGIVPVVQIDDVIIGDGHPGKWTRFLHRSYRAWVEEHLEPI